ncbi:PilZ domain-containing protein [Kamptonema cortianum]|nr:PilZ domain-containing protein [Kamptonema cortianum]
MTVVRVKDNFPTVGKVISVESPTMVLELESDHNLLPNDEIECGVGDGVSYARIKAQVVSVIAGSATLWVTAQSIQPGHDRAPRAIAVGIVATLQTPSGEQIDTSVLNASETGLAVSTLVGVPMSALVDVEISIDRSTIRFAGKIVRANQENGSPRVELGIQIVDIDRLTKAKWGHFVTTLLNRNGLVGHV